MKKDKPLSTLERLKKLREAKMVEMQRVIHDLDELDNQVKWCERFPVIADICERMRKI